MGARLQWGTIEEVCGPRQRRLIFCCATARASRSYLSELVQLCYIRILICVLHCSRGLLQVAGHTRWEGSCQHALKCAWHVRAQKRILQVLQTCQHHVQIPRYAEQCIVSGRLAGVTPRVSTVRPSGRQGPAGRTALGDSDTQATWFNKFLRPWLLGIRQRRPWVRQQLLRCTMQARCLQPLVIGSQW